MPARKPGSLNRRHDTKADQQQRAADESAMTPGRELPQSAPARLQGHEVARATWRRMIREWGSMEGKVATRLDMDLLIDYCLLMEQIGELDLMRKVAYQVWLELSKAHNELKKEARKEPDPAKAADKAIEAVEMAIKVVGAFDAVIKLDGRADRKRDLLHKWRQSLYLTPRSRAGVAPKRKEDEPPPDDMEQLLDDVGNFVNDKQDEQDEQDGQ